MRIALISDGCDQIEGSRADISARTRVACNDSNGQAAQGYAAMRIKLSSWQRLGIVLSVIGFLGICAYGWHVSDQESDAEWSRREKACQAFVGKLYWKDDEEYKKLSAEEKEKTATDAFIGKLTDKEQAIKDKVDAKNAMALRQCYDQSRRYVEYAKQEIRKLWLAIDVLTVVFGWLFGWFGFAVVRWIKRGFQS